MSRRFTVEQRKKTKSLVLEGVCQHKTTGDIRRKENIGFEISEGEQLMEGISFEIDNVIFFASCGSCKWYSIALCDGW